MSIYIQTVPYFYIIRNKETGKMYAGSKWKEGCHPDNFMTPEGYKTSSPTINSIINEFGLDIFEILRIDTYCDGIHVYDYETIFLQTNNCAKSDNWYNGHNNDGKAAFGCEKYLEKTKETCVRKYGYIHNSQIPEIKQKKKQTILKNYGYEYALQVPEIKEKHTKTMLEKYGCENIMELQEFRNKIKQTKLEKYGDENYINLEKAKITNLNKYGVDSPNKSPKVKETKKKSLLEKYGVDHISKIKKICPHCEELKSISHHHQCKMNPNKPIRKKGKN